MGVLFAVMGKDRDGTNCYWLNENGGFAGGLGYTPVDKIPLMTLERFGEMLEVSKLGYSSHVFDVVPSEDLPALLTLRDL